MSKGKKTLAELLAEAEAIQAEIAATKAAEDEARRAEILKALEQAGAFGMEPDALRGAVDAMKKDPALYARFLDAGRASAPARRGRPRGSVKRVAGAEIGAVAETAGEALGGDLAGGMVAVEDPYFGEEVI